MNDGFFPQTNIPHPRECGCSRCLHAEIERLEGVIFREWRRKEHDDDSEFFAEFERIKAKREGR